jgi:hypothetical protein
VTSQEAHSAAIWLLYRFRVGWGVSDVQAAFVTTLATGVAEQQTNNSDDKRNISED